MKHPLVILSALQRLIERKEGTAGVGEVEQGKRGGGRGEQLCFSGAEYKASARVEFMCKPAPHQDEDAVSGVLYFSFANSI